MFQRMTNRVWRRFGPQDSGQDLLEYALLAALIAVVAVGGGHTGRVDDSRRCSGMPSLPLQTPSDALVVGDSCRSHRAGGGHRSAHAADSERSDRHAGRRRRSDSRRRRLGTCGPRRRHHRLSPRVCLHAAGQCVWRDWRRRRQAVRRGRRPARTGIDGPRLFLYGDRRRRAGAGGRAAASPAGAHHRHRPRAWWRVEHRRSRRSNRRRPTIGLRMRRRLRLAS